MWVWRDSSGRIASVTGSIHQGTLDWLLAEDAWRFGAVEVAPAPASAPIIEQQPVEPVAHEEILAPKQYASKSEWVAYVVAKTADGESPVSEEDADAMTKDDLIELYGG
ncbi:hypothetical protein BA059_16870 [Mycolicibacterium sp. (ex Dasyatis americana)]|nr:hypothetical protein BA059_16870 [Mycolicibacterium sp. (ex Dasyatis americana)]